MCLCLSVTLVILSEDDLALQKIENPSLQQSPNCHPIAVTNKYRSLVSIKIVGYINPEQKTFWIRHVFMFGKWFLEGVLRSFGCYISTDKIYKYLP